MVETRTGPTSVRSGSQSTTATNTAAALTPRARSKRGRRGTGRIIPCLARRTGGWRGTQCSSAGRRSGHSVRIPPGVPVPTEPGVGDGHGRVVLSPNRLLRPSEDADLLVRVKHDVEPAVGDLVIHD